MTSIYEALSAKLKGAKCSRCAGRGMVDDAEPGDIGFRTSACGACRGSGFAGAFESWVRKASLKELLDVLHVTPEVSDQIEMKNACALIIEVQAMDSGRRECIRAAFRHGPLLDGDVPSKAARDTLLDEGYMTKVVVGGNDGYNACTHKGAWAYRLLEAGA